MNHIEQRLLELKVSIQSSGADAHTVNKVWGAVTTLNFGGLDTAGLLCYEKALGAEDAMQLMVFGGSNPNSCLDLVGAELYRLQEAAFKLEFIRQKDLEDELVTDYLGNQRRMPAFEVGMIEIFGRDWEQRLKKPLGSSSISVAKVRTGELDEKGKAVCTKVYKQIGCPVLSSKPIEVGKHPKDDCDRLVHSPMEHLVECGVMLKDTYWALATKSSEGELKVSTDLKIGDGGKNAGMGNMASGKGERRVFIVGVVEHVKSRQCREIGVVEIAEGVYFNLADFTGMLADAMLRSDEEGDLTSLEEVMKLDPLVMYYRNKFPGKDPRILAANAWAGVGNDKLMKNGLAKSVYLPMIDRVRQNQNMEKWIVGEIDNIIRKLYGLKKLNSAERLLKPHLEVVDVTSKSEAELDAMSDGDFSRAMISADMSDYYDEVYIVTDGHAVTYYEQARWLLAQRWKNNARSAVKELTPKNFGKCGRSKDFKRRTGDKSTTVNGARCAVLTAAVAHVEVTTAWFEEFESFGFSDCGDGDVQFAGMVDANEFASMLNQIGFDWNAYLADYPIQCGREKMSRDDMERVVTQMMIRYTSLSITRLLESGNHWVTVADKYAGDSLVEIRHVETVELKALQSARELVMKAGEELTARNVLDAMRKPGKWTRKSGGKIGSAVSVERMNEIRAMLAA